jgi:hypothetical protein
MTRPQYPKCAILVLGAMLIQTECFVPSVVVNPPQQRHVSALHLLPSQGKQLVAAYEAYTCKSQQGLTPVQSPPSNSDGVIQAGSSNTAKNAAIAFVSRVFHLPSHFVPHREDHKEHHHEWVDGLRLRDLPLAGRISGAGDEPDVLYYPVVGFQFVEDEDHHYRVLPTTLSVSCRLPLTHKEEVFGWYSQACPLDMFAEDPCVGPEHKN